MDLIRNFLDKQRNKKLNIHCIGDSMIDEYYDVSITKISQEYPIPVMHSNKDKCIKKPGGVANVAHQFQNLNTNPNLICFSNTESTIVFRDHALNYVPFTTTSCNIPKKRRFLDNGIQVARWDIEEENLGLNNPDDARNDALTMTDHFEKPDVCILSDYNKGFFNPKFSKLWLERYRDSITIVDPKHGPLDQWKNCTVFKPNATEAFQLTGLTNPKDQCLFLQKELNCKSVIITQSGKGFTGIDENGIFEYINDKYLIHPASSIGAGDCFVAFLAQSLGLGFNYEDSARIAFEAGALYVTNNMNRPIVLAELIKDKKISPEDLLKRNFKLVFTNGCFDILHRGHLQTLNFAKSKGDKLVVALNSDDSVKKLKGTSRPIQPLEERMSVMASLEMVDFVVEFQEETPLEIIKKCKPNVLVKGGDYQTEEIVGYGVVPEVYVSPMIDGLSTTKMING